MSHTTYVSPASSRLSGALTSADRTDPISLRRLRLPRLKLSRRVRFTNRFTGQAIDLRIPAPFPSSGSLPSSRRGLPTFRLTKGPCGPLRPDRRSHRSGDTDFLGGIGQPGQIRVADLRLSRLRVATWLHPR